MTALGEWLKQLILIVLLAVFADMLLPAKAMQRYVRVVMGLAIIAAMLQPMLPYFQRDWVDKVAGTVTQEILSTPTTEDTNSVNDHALTQELNQQTSNEANRLLASRLQAGIVSAVGCPVSSVTVSGTEQGASQISVNVHVSLSNIGKSPAIQDWVASTLQIPADQVTVSAS